MVLRHIAILSTSELTLKAAEIIDANFVICHGQGAASVGIGYIYDVQMLISNGIIIPRDLTSLFYQMVDSNLMFQSYPLSNSDKDILRLWILDLP